MRCLWPVLCALLCCVSWPAAGQRLPRDAATEAFFDRVRADRLEAARALGRGDYRAAVRGYQTLADRCERALADKRHCIDYYSMLRLSASRVGDQATVALARARLAQLRAEMPAQTAAPESFAELIVRVQTGDETLDAAAAERRLRSLVNVPPGSDALALYRHTLALIALAQLRDQAGDLAQAEAYFAEALQSADLGDEAADTPHNGQQYYLRGLVLRSHALMLWHAERLGEAERLFRGYLRATQGVAGSELMLLAQLIEQQERPADALATYRAALQATIASHVPTHPTVISVAETVAAAAARHDAPGEARALLQFAMATIRRRIESYPVYDAAAQEELRRYTPTYRRSVAVAWQLGR